MHDAPTSPRLAFRPLGDDDVPDLERHWNDRDVRRHLWDDQPVARAVVAEVVAASRASFRDAGYGIWALIEDGVLIGTCGLRPLGTREVEILYSVAPARWRDGIATEAASAVLGYAFATAGLARVFGGADHENPASRRVLEKVGMRPAAPPEGAAAGIDWLVVERERCAAVPRA